MIKILIMGLPGSGKTTFAKQLKNFLEKNNKSVDWFNADILRTKYNDWDFTEEGRIRQSLRMKECASSSKCHYVLCDFVAPLPKMRDILKADFIIWMNTIEKSRYDDTNNAFVVPKVYDFCIKEKNALKWSQVIGQFLLNKK